MTKCDQGASPRASASTDPSGPDPSDEVTELAIVAGALTWLLFHANDQPGRACSLAEVAIDADHLTEPLSSYGISSLRWMEVLTVIEDELGLMIPEEAMVNRLDKQMSLYELSDLLLGELKERSTTNDRI